MPPDPPKIPWHALPPPNLYAKPPPPPNSEKIVYTHHVIEVIRLDYSYFFIYTRKLYE